MIWRWYEAYTFLLKKKFVFKNNVWNICYNKQQKWNTLKLGNIVSKISIHYICNHMNTPLWMFCIYKYKTMHNIYIYIVLCECSLYAILFYNFVIIFEFIMIFVLFTDHSFSETISCYLDIWFSPLNYSWIKEHKSNFLAQITVTFEALRSMFISYYETTI